MSLSTIVLEVGGVFEQSANQDSSGNIGYSVSPTSGGSGAVEVGAVYCSDSSNALTLGANTQAWDWGTRPGQSIVLRGTGEQLAVYLAGSVATQTMLVTYEWTEE
jgi:hypothetical protein